MNIDNVLRDHGLGFGCGSNIKSIQRVFAEWTPNTKTVTKDISVVDESKTIVLFSSMPINTAPAQNQIMARILSPSTLQFDIGAVYNSTTPYFEAVVIEFEDVRSIQKGTVVLTNGGYGAYDNFLISEVDISKSLVFGSHKNTFPQVVTSENSHIYRLSTSKQLSIGTSVSGVTTAHYQIIEFN